jgi:hypothetical protein
MIRFKEYISEKTKSKQEKKLFGLYKELEKSNSKLANITKLKYEPKSILATKKEIKDLESDIKTLKKNYPELVKLVWDKKKQKVIIKEKFLNADERVSYTNKLFKDYSTAYMEVFVNPTIKEAPSNARGIIDKKGNLYVMNNKNNNFIHIDLGNFLHEQGIIPVKVDDDYGEGVFIRHFLGVQRVGRSNVFERSESYTGNVLKHFEGKINDYIKKAQKKNPQWKFYEV